MNIFTVTLNSTFELNGETFTVNDDGSIITFGGYGLADFDDGQDRIEIDEDFEIASVDVDHIEDNSTEFEIVITEDQINKLVEYRKQYPAII